jgi:hypothetical protein
MFFDASGAVIDTSILDVSAINPAYIEPALYDSLKDVLVSLKTTLESIPSDVTDMHNFYKELRTSLLDETTMVWGQGFYLSPMDSTSGWRGKRMRLDLDEFWIADGGWDLEPPGPYYHRAKPDRSTAYANQFPIRSYLERMTPNNSHTMHFRFGFDGSDAKVTASLYVVYNQKVRR